MKLNPYSTNCPKCESGVGVMCVRPLKKGRPYRAIPPHKTRRKRAQEITRLRLTIERRQAGYLWGQKHFFTPRLLGEVFGDGKQLIWISGINTRPAFWAVRVDSSWSLDNWGESPVLADHLEEIYQAIEGEYGTGEKEDGSLYAKAQFPEACGLGSGCQWGEFTQDDSAAGRNA